MLQRVDISMVCMAAYGAVIYIAAFRKLGNAQFEMALQPEKILYFIFAEQVFLKLRDMKKSSILSPRTTVRPGPKRLMGSPKVLAINVLLATFVILSLGYPLSRFCKRFYPFRFIKAVVLCQDTRTLIPLSSEKSQVLELDTVKGMVVSADQAEEFKILNRFVQEHSSPQEPVFMFPELGAYSFIVNRPFVGRFPMVTLSWLKESWYQELLSALRKAPPRLAVVSKDPGPSFELIYFVYSGNREKYEEVLDFISEHYSLAGETQSLLFYRWKN